MNQQKKLAKTEIQMNRLRAQKAALSFKIKHQQNSERKARTRTLIQMGGLLEITPLPSICNINLGDDLQLDHPEKSATLLGLLLHISEQIIDTVSSDDLEKFRKIGVNYLKKNAR
ncbi:MAG: conjugal transfer protein TraD [Holosporaceae bacterium]|jgi:hypothetical protein|nr:conjugal transfer protein TraD [Holosporaceae bacterium]